MYVTDEWLNRVSIFDKDGNFLRDWGMAGSGDGEFNGPSGIAIDPQDVLYIVDSRNHRVQKFTKDGEFLAKWGSLGSAEGQFNAPWGITIDQQGHVYVADHKNHRVQKFTPDGEFIMPVRQLWDRQGPIEPSLRRGRRPRWRCVCVRLGQPPRASLRPRWQGCHQSLWAMPRNSPNGPR